VTRTKMDGGVKRRGARAAWAVALVVLAGACTVTVDNTQIVDDSARGVTGVVTTTGAARRPADEGDLADVALSADAVTLTYRGEAPRFAAGDVIVGSEGAGYLRRVIAAEHDGGVVRLATVDAGLGEAFESIEIAAPTVALVPDAPIVVAAADTVQTLTAVDGTVYRARVRHGAATARAATIDVAWEFPDLEVVLEDPAGNIAFTLAAETLRVEKRLTLDFGVTWRFFTLRDLRMVIDDQTTYSIERFSVRVDGHLPRFQQEIPLVSSPVLATVPVGPLVFTVGGGVSLGVDAMLSAAAEVHTTSDVSLTTRSRRGATWDGALHPVNDSDVAVDADVGGVEVGRADVTLDADFFVAGKVNVALYGIAGPELWGRLAPVTSHLVAGFTGWSVELGAAATGGLRFALPLFGIEPLSFDFGTWEETYYTASGTW
jgi:hypothetical protein